MNLDETSGWPEDFIRGTNAYFFAPVVEDIELKK